MCIRDSNSIECPNCGELKLSHHVCASCGYYNKKPVILKNNLENQGKVMQFMDLSESLQKDIEILSLEGFINDSSHAGEK